MLLNRLIDSDVSESFHQETRERFVQLTSTFSIWLLVNKSSVPPPADWRISLCTFASVSSCSLLSSRPSVWLSVNFNSVLSVSRNCVYFPAAIASLLSDEQWQGEGKAWHICAYYFGGCWHLSVPDFPRFFFRELFSLLMFPRSFSIIFFIFCLLKLYF